MLVKQLDELIGDLASHMAEQETGYNPLVDPESFGPDPVKTKARDQWISRATSALGFLREADQLRAFFPTTEQ
jgi:hypothetical protein